VVFSFTLSSSGGGDKKIWNRPWFFYVGIALPCVLGLFIANLFTSYLRLKKPERVTVSVECCYQNVGIATSVALTMFDGDDLAEAMGVPLYYGLLEAVILGLYCIAAWKIGWTKAPPNVSFCNMLFNSYEVLLAEKAEEELQSIEIMLVNTDNEVDMNKEDDAFFAYFKLDDKVFTGLEEAVSNAIVNLPGTKERKRPSGLNLEIPQHLEDDNTVEMSNST